MTHPDVERAEASWFAATRAAHRDHYRTWGPDDPAYAWAIQDADRAYRAAILPATFAELRR